MWWEAEHPPNPKKSDVTYRTWNASRPCIALLGWETGEGSETIRVMNNHVFSKNIQFRVCNLYKNLDFAAISFQSKDISIQRQLELEKKSFQKICYQKLLKDCNKFKYFYVFQKVQRGTAWLLTIETCWANEGHLDFLNSKPCFLLNEREIHWNHNQLFLGLTIAKVLLLLLTIDSHTPRPRGLWTLQQGMSNQEKDVSPLQSIH